MKKISLILLLTFIAASAISQKVFFVYIQSEANQPFFVQMKEKVFSSSASGYIILSKLTDTTHSFSIGFPRSNAQYFFSVAINKKDHGYLLKDFGVKGWGLFDRQLLTVQMGSTTLPGSQEVKAEVRKDASPFTEGLAKASDDPSLKERPVKVVEEKKPVAVQPDVVVVVTEKSVEKSIPQVVTPKEETPVVVKEEPKPLVVKEEPKVAVVKEEPKQVAEVKEIPVVTEEKPLLTADKEYGKSVVRKRSESSTTEGFGLVYVDSFPNGNSDTIRLLIPEPKTIAGVITEEPKEEKKFLDISSNPEKKEEQKADVPVVPVVKEEKPKDVVTIAPVVTSTEKPVIKNNCAALAADADFFQLRKVMAAAESDDDMISEARKAYKSKCFSVQQIKNLSTMFLNEEGKYRFFDAVYNCASDQERFSSLEAELKDEYYIKRFRAMLRN